jgi:hypothetical protein
MACHTWQPYLVCACGQTHHLSLLTDTNTKRHGVLRKRRRQHERWSHDASQALRDLRSRRRQLRCPSCTPQPSLWWRTRQWSGCTTLLCRCAPHPRPHGQGRSPRGGTLHRVPDGAVALKAVERSRPRSSTSRRTTSSLKLQGRVRATTDKTPFTSVNGDWEAVEGQLGEWESNARWVDNFSRGDAFADKNAN